MNSCLIAPASLQPGDAVALICPSGFMPAEAMSHAEEALSGAGFVVKPGLTARNQHFYFSGTDDLRLADLQAALDDPDIKAIFCGRGGYGLSRIMHLISLRTFLASPKWVLGFSDVTLLLQAIEQAGVQCIHGPMAAAFQPQKGYMGLQYAQSSLLALAGKPVSVMASVHPLNVAGKVTAPVTGGNLCMLAHLCGSGFHAASVSGKILFLEEVGEYLYGIDRLLWQLSREGIFEAVAGVVLGSFSDTKDTVVPFGQSLLGILHHHFGHREYPVAYQMPVGHGTENVALVQGRTYTLDVSAQRVYFRPG